MKVALLSPLLHPIVEPFAGGTEAFIARFAEGLVRRGIEVVCYACEGSSIPGVEIRTLGIAKGALVFPRALQELNGEEALAIRAYEDAVMHQALEDACGDPSVDIVHNHSFSALPLFLSRRFPIPILHTLHLPPMLPNMMEALRFCCKQDIPLQLVAVSQRQRELWRPYYPAGNVIYNGLEVEALPLNVLPERRLAFVGRIDQAKGVEDAIAVATLLNMPLDIYGPIQPASRSYFENSIYPLLQSNPLLSYRGQLPQETLFQRLSQAQALLFPVKWDEPFGNVALEAMAVGVPVVMYDRGSAQELLVKGINGAIVPPDDTRAMAEAVAQVAKLDRAVCARYARERFSMATCVEQYLALMQMMVGSK